MEMRGYQSVKRKGFLVSDKGYYVYGFMTTINQATQKDVDLAETYGIELVSQYEGITPTLLFMLEKSKQATLSTQTYTYQIRTGVMIMGELKIMVQILPKDHYRITYLYNYRTDLGEYRKKNNIRATKRPKSETVFKRQKTKLRKKHMR